MNKVKKHKNYEGFELSIKRCYIPATLTSKCPKCDSLVERDFTDHYISYPIMGAPTTITMYHECDPDADEYDYCEWEVKVRLDFKIKILE